MKYLTYTNFGCIDLCKNMIRSLTNCGVNTDVDVHVRCFDKESQIALIDFGVSNATLWRELGKELKEYQNWSFDPGSAFAKIVSWKWKIIREFYKEHKEIVFVDTDVVFVKHPEEDLRSYGKNICIQCDSPGSLYCTGFMYFKESPEADLIINACANNHCDDQIIFNRFVNELNLSSKIQLLSHEKYPNGHSYYKTNLDKSQALMIHNNHMLGKEAKIEKFEEIGRWYN